MSLACCRSEDDTLFWPYRTLQRSERTARRICADSRRAGGLETGDCRQRRCLWHAADRKTILYFGRIEPYKGLNVLLAAFARIRGVLADWKLVIAGSGDVSGMLQIGRRYSILAVSNPTKV